MLKELSQKDSKWRSYALWLTKDKSKADDLVQDMYLKLHDQQKQINDFFVITTMRNAFYDAQKKKKREIINDDFSYFEYNTNTYELDDEHKEIIDYVLSSCNWWEEELLEMSAEHSLRDLQARYNINYGFIYKTLKRIKDDVKNKYNGR